MNTLTINIDLATTPVDAVAEVLRILNGSAPAEVKKPVKKAEIVKADDNVGKVTEPVTVTATASEPETTATVKPYTVEEVRALAAERRKAGVTPAAIKAVLSSHGADSITTLDPTKYATVYSELQNLK